VKPVKYISTSFAVFQPHLNPEALTSFTTLGLQIFVWDASTAEKVGQEVRGEAAGYFVLVPKRV
jgi:hypothetical protein